jgi:hypothetical protein
VKHQRGIVGADMASILAKRNQTSQARVAQRTAAIQKAKSEKKEKESKKTKVLFRSSLRLTARINSICKGPASPYDGTQSLEAGEGRKGPLTGGFGMLDSSYTLSICISPCTMQNAFTCTGEACSQQSFRRSDKY